MTLDERRKFPRYYAPPWLMADGEFPCQRGYRLKVTEISIEGIRFISNVVLPREGVFNLSFEVRGKGDERRQISVQAALLWHTCDEVTKLYTGGAQFLGMTDSNRELLAEFLETLDKRNGSRI